MCAWLGVRRRTLSQVVVCLRGVKGGRASDQVQANNVKIIINFQCYITHTHKHTHIHTHTCAQATGLCGVLCTLSGSMAVLDRFLRDVQVRGCMHTF